MSRRQNKTKFNLRLSPRGVRVLLKKFSKAGLKTQVFLQTVKEFFHLHMLQLCSKSLLPLDTFNANFWYRNILKQENKFFILRKEP